MSIFIPYPKEEEEEEEMDAKLGAKTSYGSDYENAHHPYHEVVVLWAHLSIKL